MSTSYYWILDEDGRAPTGKVVDKRDHDNPDWHIGKISATPFGHPRRFHWAQSPESVTVITTRHFHNPCIVDEYGRRLSGSDFAALIWGATWLTADVGQWFG